MANKSINDYINDLSSLDVVTLTGDLTIDVKDMSAKATDGDEEKKPLRFGQIMRQLEGNILDGKSEVSALAITHISLDRDTVTFVKKDLSPEEVAYLNFHNETVKAAGLARSALAGGIVKLLLAKQD
jgi:hypothetical protein